ncbi:hypothetical protein Leryth_011373 [Lithospermum erythrorhizon]|nr:hypothetical protein Leryth_011373 [Lithospermum erythrorhizon]
MVVLMPYSQGKRVVLELLIPWGQDNHLSKHIALSRDLETDQKQNSNTEDVSRMMAKDEKCQYTYVLEG